jgi:hypothetical protein
MGKAPEYGLVMMCPVSLSVEEAVTRYLTYDTSILELKTEIDRPAT